MTPLDLTTTADEHGTTPGGSTITRHGATITTWTGNTTDRPEITYHRDEDHARAAFVEAAANRATRTPRVGDRIAVTDATAGVITNVNGYRAFTVSLDNGQTYLLTPTDYVIKSRPALTLSAPYGRLFPDGTLSATKVPAGSWFVTITRTRTASGDLFEIVLDPAPGNPATAPIVIGASNSQRAARHAAWRWYEQATVGLPYGRLVFTGNAR